LYSKSGSHSSSRKIWWKSSNNSSLVTMSFAYLTPNSSKFRSLFFVMSFVDVYNSLTKIILAVLGSVNIFNSKDGLTWCLVLSISFETYELRFNPESNWSWIILSSVFRSLCFDHWFINFLIFKVFWLIRWYFLKINFMI